MSSDSRFRHPLPHTQSPTAPVKWHSIFNKSVPCFLTPLRGSPSLFHTPSRQQHCLLLNQPPHVAFRFFCLGNSLCFMATAPPPAGAVEMQQNMMEARRLHRPPLLLLHYFFLGNSFCFMAPTPPPAPPVNAVERQQIHEDALLPQITAFLGYM